MTASSRCFCCERCMFAHIQRNRSLRSWSLLEKSVFCHTRVCYCICSTVRWLAGLQLPQPQPCAGRVARVGTAPDCRQAHYLSLAKGKKGRKRGSLYKKHFNQERAFICCLTLREFPLLFTQLRARIHTHHVCHKSKCSTVVNKNWVCPCFGVCRVHLEVFAQERGLDLKTLLLCLGSDESFSKTLKEPYGLETKQNKTKTHKDDYLWVKHVSLLWSPQGRLLINVF